MAKYCLAEASLSYLNERHRGVVKHWLGTDRVLDLELGARWLVLLELGAAFPSLSHRFLLRVVGNFARRRPLAVMIADLARDASTELLVSGGVYVGFAMIGVFACTCFPQSDFCARHGRFVGGGAGCVPVRRVFLC